MNKQDLINAVAKATGSSKVAANNIVNAVIDSIREGIKKRKKVRIIGFGSFSSVPVAAKVVKSPRDGSSINVPACNRVRFSAGKDLRQAANS